MPPGAKLSPVVMVTEALPPPVVRSKVPPSTCSAPLALTASPWAVMVKVPSATYKKPKAESSAFSAWSPSLPEMMVKSPPATARLSLPVMPCSAAVTV